MEVFVIPKSTSFGVLPTWDNVMTPTLMPTYIHYYADQINYTQTHTHTHNTLPIKYKIFNTCLSFS